MASPRNPMDAEPSPTTPAPPASGPQPTFGLPYRVVYAVATQDAVHVYDTQQQRPLCVRRPDTSYDILRWILFSLELRTRRAWYCLSQSGPGHSTPYTDSYLGWQSQSIHCFNTSGHAYCRVGTISSACASTNSASPTILAIWDASAPSSISFTFYKSSPSSFAR
ncbi:hypothetical protein KC355_g22390 [Hortaea werneckii]|nr:hypothetical protein KC355_g22390 [Hortaea werneckii]